MGKVVYVLKDDEKNQIEELYEKKMALENLCKIIDPCNEKMYNKLLEDYGKIMFAYTNWWNEMSSHYKWEGENWFINFSTKEVIQE